MSCDESIIIAKGEGAAMQKDVSLNKEDLVSKAIDFTNPAMILGTDIGRLFNAYYRTGQTDQLIPFLNLETRLGYSRKELQDRLAQLDYGVEMKLSGLQKQGQLYILSDKCVVNATTIVKRLKVIVEDDTCRIVPQDFNLN